MNLYFRFLLLLLKRIIVTKHGNLFSECRTRFRVNVFDLDLNFHMNNGRYLALMDLGRLDLMLKANIFGKLVRKGYYPVISSEGIRFKKSLHLLQSFELVTQLESWDDKNLYIAQQFIHKGHVVAEGMIKGRFLQRGRKGSVPTSELFSVLGIEPFESDSSERAKCLAQFEGMLAVRKKH